MSSVAFCLFMMLLYMIAGGLYIGDAVTEFKAGHYRRFGIAVMFALSIIACMVKFIFTW